jgi:hypothetical protein
LLNCHDFAEVRHNQPIRATIEAQFANLTLLSGHSNAKRLKVWAASSLTLATATDGMCIQGKEVREVRIQILYATKETLKNFQGIYSQEEGMSG